MPNWVGDVVMALGFLDAVLKRHPEAEIHIIIKKEIADLITWYQPGLVLHRFSKKEHGGLAGMRRFGKEVGKSGPFEAFFCLPDSFSSAFIGLFTRSKLRFGFPGEGRFLLLNRIVRKPEHQHRVEEYLALLEAWSGKVSYRVPMLMPHKPEHRFPLGTGKFLLFNINSEASSRRLPAEKAVAWITQLRQQYGFEIVFTGSPKEQAWVEPVEQQLAHLGSIHNYCGKTSLWQLMELVQSVDYVISVDTGLAHMANAFLKKTIILQGAAEEKHTGPWNAENVRLVRQPGLECAPCRSNTCQFGTPKCLADMETFRVMQALEELMQGT